MRTIKISLGALVILFALWLLPQFISLQSEVQLAEVAASKSLGVPVKINQARLALLPSPRLTVAQVTIAKPAAVVIQNVAIKPQWFSLFSANKVVDVHAQAVTLSPAAISAYPQLMLQLQGNTAVISNRLPVMLGTLNIAALNIQEMADLPPLALSAQFEQLKLKTLLLVDQAETLHLRITPQQASQHLALHLKSFVWASTPQIMVEQGEVSATLRGDQLQVDHVTLSLLGGQLTGEGGLRWLPKASIEARFKFNQLALAPLLGKPSGDGVYLTGLLAGQGRLYGRAHDLSALPEHGVLAVDAVVTRGVLHGIDLSQLSKLLLKKDAHGETQFDALTTHLNWQGTHLRFKPLSMQSGLLRAEGHLDVMEGQLTGELSVAVKNSAGMLAVPLEVRGPVASPTVLPQKAPMLGAAVGTVLLPGVGTGLGLKAGSQLNAWFGGQQ